MNTQLTPQQIADYQRDGFVAHRGLLSADEVAELKGAVLESVAQLGKKKFAGDAREAQEGESYYDSVFTQRVNLWRINDTVKKYMLDPSLGKMCCDLEGIDGIRVWHDQTLIKEPFGNPTAWHLDNPYWSFSSRHAISVWIALEPATQANGCMYFLPGTHKSADFTSVSIGENMAGLFKHYPEMKQIDPVGVPMQPGDCSFHNGLTAHGAGANMTRDRRIAMTCAYMPAGSTFNGRQNILSEKLFNSLSEGDVLENDEQNPLVYAR